MLVDVIALKGTLKLRQQVRAGGGAGWVVSSCTPPFRCSAAGLALALTDVMDILNSNFKAQAPGGMGYGCRGGFALVGFAMLVICAKRAWMVSEMRKSWNSGSVRSERMPGTATAKIYTISSIEGL